MALGESLAGYEGYDGERLDLMTDFEDMLAQGSAIQAYSTGGGIRVARILDHLESSDAPLLGYGSDTSVEDALMRARDSYILRESRGEERITSFGGDNDPYAQFVSPVYTTDAGPGSQLDEFIMCRGLLRAIGEDDQVLAWDAARGKKNAVAAPTLAIATQWLCAFQSDKSSYLL